MISSRHAFLETQLDTLGYKKSLSALDLVVKEMSKEKGFKRHNGVHYYYHLIDVAQMLLNFGVREEDIITASLLHDFVEDVKWASITFISETYGDNVADYVRRVTKKPGVNYKQDKEEMKEYVKVVMEKIGSALIKTVDRMNNFGTMRHSTVEHKLAQARETREFYIPMFKECRSLYPRYSKIFFQAKTTIEPLLYEIESNAQIVEELNNRIKELEQTSGC